LDQDKERHRSYSGAQPRHKNLRGAMAYKLVQVSVTLILLAVTFSGCKKGAGQKKIDKALKIMNEDNWCDKEVKAALGDGAKPMHPNDFIKKVTKAFVDDAGKAKKEYGKMEDVEKKLKEFTKKWNKQEKKDILDKWTLPKKKNTTKNQKVKGKSTGKGTGKGKKKAEKDGDGDDAAPDEGGDNNGCSDHFKENPEDEAPAGDDSPPVSTADISEPGAPKPPRLNVVHLHVGN